MSLSVPLLIKANKLNNNFGQKCLCKLIVNCCLWQPWNIVALLCLFVFVCVSNYASYLRNSCCVSSFSVGHPLCGRETEYSHCLSDSNADLKCPRRVARRVLCLMFLFALLPRRPLKVGAHGSYAWCELVYVCQIVVLGIPMPHFPLLCSSTTCPGPAQLLFMRRTWQWVQALFSVRT